MARRKARGPYVVVIVLAVAGAYVLNRGLDLNRLQRDVDSVLSHAPDVVQRAPRSTVGGSVPDRIRIATWNVRMLSSNSRDDRELAKIADMIAQFDIVAIQEVRDTRVLDRLQRRLPGWSYVASRPVGTAAHKERYAYFWQADRVDLLGDAATVEDPSDILIREPFAATFSSGDFDFTLCTIHVLYGTSVPARRREIRVMDELVAAVQAANGAEDDVILLGDFNFPPDDPGWQLDGYRALVHEPNRTTIGSRSLYDNIWLDPRRTVEFDDAVGIVAFDESDYAGNLDVASREMSDHRPVWATFETTRDDDNDEYGDLRRAILRTPGLP